MKKQMILMIRKRINDIMNKVKITMKKTNTKNDYIF